MSGRRRLLMLLAVAAAGVVVAGIAVAGRGDGNDKTFVYAIGLWGDLPYSAEQGNPGVPNLIADMNNSDIAFSVPLWPDGTVTLNRQRRFGMAKPSIEVPGGHVDPGETPLVGARRELREETGLVAKKMTRLLTCFSSIKVQQRVHLF